jgi:hypothetical protein
MGVSPSQARKSLSTMTDRMDVQVTLNSLLIPEIHLESLTRNVRGWRLGGQSRGCSRRQEWGLCRVVRGLRKRKRDSDVKGIFFFLLKKSKFPPSNANLTAKGKRNGRASQKGDMKSRGEREKKEGSRREFQGRRRSDMLAFRDILRRLPIDSQQLAVSG